LTLKTQPLYRAMMKSLVLREGTHRTLIDNSWVDRGIQDFGAIWVNLLKRFSFKNSFGDSVTQVGPGSLARVFEGVFKMKEKGWVMRLCINGLELGLCFVHPAG